MSVHVIALPDGVDLELSDTTTIALTPDTADAVIVFVSSAPEVDSIAGAAIAAARDDRLAWVAYPKAGGLGTDLNRDRLAALMIERDTRPVRQVAIDTVWSALRFRPARDGER